MLWGGIFGAHPLSGNYRGGKKRNKSRTSNIRYHFEDPHAAPINDLTPKPEGLVRV